MSNNLFSTKQIAGISFFLIIVLIYFTNGFVFISQIQAPHLGFPELPKLFPKYNSHEIMTMYGSPSDLQTAIDNCTINYNDLPDNIKKQVKPGVC